MSDDIHDRYEQLRQRAEDLVRERDEAVAKYEALKREFDNRHAELAEERQSFMEPRP